MTRVLVCGGRDFTNADLLNRELDRLHAEHGFGGLIEGGAPGADTLAGVWADARGVPRQTFPADWKKHRRAAGPIRNQQMLDEGKPDLVVAFPGGTGTAGMMKLAKTAGVRIVEVKAPAAQSPAADADEAARAMARAG